MKDKAYILDLVQQLRNKEVLALQGLYKMFSKEMMASSLRITNSKSDSEDILQEAFVHSYQKIKQLKEDQKYGSWLKRIVINASLKSVKNRRHFENLSSIDISDEILDEEDYKGFSMKLIRDEIQLLPNGCREIFSLYLIEGYKHKEIAVALGVSISTSKSQYSYALKLLKQALIPKVYE